MANLLLDLRYGFRNLLHHRGFAATAIVILGLGIGANSAIFSVLNPLLFRPLDAADPDRLCRVFSGRTGGSLYGRMSYPNYVDLRDEARSFAALAAYSWPTPFSAGLGTTERIWGAVVSGNYFDTLGVSASLGRTLAPDDDRAPGARAVVVISHRLWQAKFGADPRVVGQHVRLNGQPFEIIGVAPRRMAQPELLFHADLWVPMSMQASAMPGLGHKPTSRAETWLSVIGRLRPTTALDEARAELGTRARSMERSHPKENARLALTALPERRGRTMAIPVLAPFAWGLLGLVGLVLFVACANIASLMLAHTAARWREFAIRLSLGAARTRLAQQLLTESVLLALFGGMLGLAIGVLVTRQLVSLVPPLPVDVFLDAGLDTRVLLFTFTAAALTGVLLALLPALRLWRSDLTSALKSGDATSGRRFGGLSIRDVLVAGQVAASMLLLIVAGLFIRSLHQAQRIELGFDPGDRLLATIDVGQAGYTEARGLAFQARLLDAIGSVPGVLAVSGTAHPPLGPGYLANGHVFVDGDATLPDERRPVVYFDKVAPQYFRAMGTPLVSGRDFTEHDRAGGPLVAVVNRTFAESLWPGLAAVARRFRINQPNGASVEVVGVVADGKYHRLGEAPQLHVYLASRQSYQSAMTLILHTEGEPQRYARAVREAVQRLDRDLPVTDVRSMTEHLGFALYPARVSAILLACVGALGLLLAMVGLHGLLAFMVRQRTRELGIRIAVGAQPREVVGLVLRQGARTLGIGMLLGFAAAALAARIIASVLYGVSPLDRVTFAAVPILLSGAALLAMFRPAAHASRIDPVVALRHE